MSTPPSQARRYARRVGQVAGWLLVLAFAAWASVRAAGIAVGHPFAQLVAFTPYAGLATLVLVVVLLGTRQWVAAAVAGAVLVTFASCLLPRAFGGSSDQPGPPLTVMSINMRVGGADPTQIVDLVREHQVDVLAVQEYTPDAAAGLADAGLGAVLPYAELHAEPSAGGSALYSRLPLRDRLSAPNPGGFWQSFATIDAAGARPVRVASVHPVPPLNAAQVPTWSECVRSEPPADAGLPQILAGDFNATLDHAELRDLIGTGYTDAAAAVGDGFTLTWPYAGRRSAVTPKITIDHVLLGPGIGARSFTAVTVAATDHRAIIAELTLPPA